MSKRGPVSVANGSWRRKHLDQPRRTIQGRDPGRERFQGKRIRKPGCSSRLDDSQVGRFLMKTTENVSTERPEDEAELSLSVGSIAIERLIEEVRSGDSIEATSYNRTYNRHNR